MSFGALKLELNLGSVLGSTQTPLQKMLAHYNSGAVEGLVLNIGDRTANLQALTGGSDVIDGTDLGFRADIRYTSGSWADYVASRTELGSEFESNVDGYEATGGVLSWEAGQAKLVSDTQNQAFHTSTVYPIAVGEWFRVEVNYDFGVGNNGQILVGTTPPGVQYEWIFVSGSGSIVRYYKATGTFASVTIRNSDTTQPQTSRTDKISFKTLPGYHAVAPANGQRGTWDLVSEVPWWTGDGSGDGHIAPKPANGLYDVYIPINTTDAQATLFSDSGGTRYVGAFKSGDSGSPHSGAGSPLYYVDDVALVSPTLGDLHTALADGNDHILVIRDFDVTLFDEIRISLRSAEGFAGRAGTVEMFPSASRTSQTHVDLYNFPASQIGATQLTVPFP